ncbi:MAG: zinc-binding dehydrogenase [Chthonomonadaceae bacterium]|nr:zinc-binding dehydrogenase [Chthonomonadaceae bacterium]
MTETQTQRAVIVDPTAGVSHLKLAEVALPTPGKSETLVRVTAISLNRGEVRMSLSAEATEKTGWRPGWDFAGMVETESADGKGLKAGTRVVGISRPGAWAQFVAVPNESIAALPDNVTDSQAATLPVAGLTAYYALAKGGFLLGKPVLITGATGGVGDYALQLAKLAGAKVVAHIRKPEQEEEVRSAGAGAVVIGEDLTVSSPFSAYHLILDAVGGDTLSQSLRLLDEGGTVVTYGTTAEKTVTFDAQKFYGTGATTLYGFILFDEFRSTDTAADGLTRLAQLVSEGKLTPRISLEADWSETPDIAAQLIDRKYPGKAVLHVK